MSAMQECPFCEPKQRVLKENEHAYFMLSNPRKVPGHTLVIPKRHIEKPSELTTEELQSIFELIYFVEERLLNTIAKGCDIRQHYRPFLPQSQVKVDHVHFHVMPRTLDDVLFEKGDKNEGALFAPLSSEEHDSIALHYK